MFVDILVIIKTLQEIINGETMHLIKINDNNKKYSQKKK